MLPSTNIANNTAQMTSISWQLNSSTGYYDIYNQFTPQNNQGNLEVIQSKILIILNTFQGEWAPQPDFGIPFQTLSQNADNPDVLAQIIVNEIISVQNVNSVNIIEFDYTAPTRLFSASFSVNTVFGVTTVTIGQ